VRTSSASTCSHPRIDRPRISIRRAFVVATSSSGLRRVDAGEHSALTARRHGHVAIDEEGEAPEHLLLGQPGLVGQQLADALREIFVVGHGGVR
jgi:hypothetical protein